MNFKVETWFSCWWVIQEIIRGNWAVVESFIKDKYCDTAWQKYVNKHLQEKTKVTKNISNNISFKVFALFISSDKHAKKLI